VRCSFVNSAMAMEIQLEANIVVVDETYKAAPSLANIARVLRLETGSEGFIQHEKALMSSVETNHQAILAVGPSRGHFDVTASLDDAAAAAMAVRQLINHIATPSVVKAVVDTVACCSCLTCLRVCPHGAISFKDRPNIIARFCEGCGQCAAECPMDAISLVAYSDERIEGEVEAAFATERPDASTPIFAVFGCKRSAVESLRLAEEFGEPMPGGMVTVELPCGGRVDEQYLLEAFDSGADGVAVIVCHEGSCHSLHGDELALERVTRLRNQLSVIGLEPERLFFGAVAPNKRVELATMLREFEAKLKELGPSPLRPTTSEKETKVSV
jgi:quinone-modifying oxidoreductase, subunit QmoB